MQNFAVIARIQELCNARGWTYYRLAKESGITYSTLSTMLNKENMPSIPTLEKLCTGFGISLCQFFADDNGWAALREDQKLYIAQWEQLDEKSKIAAERYITFLLHEQQAQE